MACNCEAARSRAPAADVRGLFLRLWKRVRLRQQLQPRGGGEPGCVATCAAGGAGRPGPCLCLPDEVAEGRRDLSDPGGPRVAGSDATDGESNVVPDHAEERGDLLCGSGFRIS